METGLDTRVKDNPAWHAMPADDVLAQLSIAKD
jgi:hypothetical protein